ncbi:hypothetical protein MUP59_02040 [Candidatus Bathyarchaeota archaeon]|nr:hypothetical protein [Candidatus Bathyarchaeota archaeon]
MSFGFRKGTSGGRGRIDRGENPDGNKQESRTGKTATSHGTVKYVEIWGRVLAGALGAGLSSRIIDYTIPDGHAAELFAVGIQPDFLLGASNILDTEIGFDNKLTGVKFRTNHLGQNALPYGDRLSKNPMRLLDYPLTKGNLTVKYNEGMRIQVVITTVGGANLSDVVARAKIYLLEAEDTSKYYGATIANLATLPGGVSQSLPTMLFSEYSLLPAATLADGKFVDLYSKSVKDYEEVKINHLGIAGGSLASADEARFYDLRNKKEFPEYEPYWKITEAFNALPYGDDDDEQPMSKLPSVVSDYVWTNTTLSVKMNDLLAVIPIGGVVAQLIGTYKRVR